MSLSHVLVIFLIVTPMSASICRDGGFFEVVLSTTHDCSICESPGGGSQFAEQCEMCCPGSSPSPSPTTSPTPTTSSTPSPTLPSTQAPADTDTSTLTSAPLTTGRGPTSAPLNTSTDDLEDTDYGSLGGGDGVDTLGVTILTQVGPLVGVVLGTAAAVGIMCSLALFLALRRRRRQNPGMRSAFSGCAGINMCNPVKEAIECTDKSVSSSNNSIIPEDKETNV